MARNMQVIILRVSKRENSLKPQQALELRPYNGLYKTDTPRQIKTRGRCTLRLARQGQSRQTVHKTLSLWLEKLIGLLYSKLLL